MRIKYLLKKALINMPFILDNHQISCLCDNSLNAKENAVFFAIKGEKDDGNNYINDAISRGAKTVIYDHEFIKENHHINYIKVADCKKSMALLAKYFYHDVTKKYKMIGVTGTNGKTTITTICFDYLSYQGLDAVLIGTNGIFFRDLHFDTNNTTPNILLIYDVLFTCYKKGARYVIMEVSSIGEREARTSYMDFDIFVFTNLGHDHLDYHKNITDYKWSKGLSLKSIENRKDKAVILNSDDETFEFYKSIVDAQIRTYGIKNSADYQAVNIVKSLYKTEFRTLIRNNKFYVKSSLIGGFNVYNLLACIAIIDFLHFDLESFVAFLRIYVSVNGRMNRISFNKRTIIIDFAHTPSSVENVLLLLKEYSNRKLTVIIGCGGNRDHAKRSIIGQIAEQYADKLIFTNDNPRDELPKKIIDDLTSKLKYNNYEVILDRKKAIEYALETSIKDEIIAILGKGAERGQIINGIVHPFNDKDVVHEYIKNNKNQ